MYSPFISSYITGKAIRTFVCLLFCVLPAVAFCQELSLRTDRSSILIGEPVTCRIELSGAPDGASIAVSIPDSIPHFDILEAVSTDEQTGRKQWVMTSFDSGRWYIPSIPVIIRQQGRERTVYTDSIAVDVLYLPADSTATVRDIKPLMQVNVSDYTWYYIAGGVLLLLLLSWLLYRYFTNRKGQTKSGEASRLTAHQEAMNRLASLVSVPLQSRVDHVYWHAELSDIFRRYASRKSGVSLESATTGDILLHYGKAGMSKEQLSELAEILRAGDAVKFAKYLPADTDTKQCVQRLSELIGQIDRQA